MPISKRQSRYTLVELIATIAVLTFVLSIGVPGILQLKRNSDLVTTVNTVVNALTYAKGEAMKRGLSVELVLVDGVWAKGWSVVLDGGELLRVFKAPSGKTAVTATQATVIFGYMGNASGATCFDIHAPGGSDGDLERSVDVNTLGRIVSCRVSCADIAGNRSLCQ